MAMIALLLALKTCEEPILEVNIVFITFDEQYVFKKRVFDVEKDVHYLNQSLRSKVKKDHSKSLEIQCWTYLSSLVHTSPQDFLLVKSVQ